MNKNKVENKKCEHICGDEKMSFDKKEKNLTKKSNVKYEQQFSLQTFIVSYIH